MTTVGFKPKTVTKKLVNSLPDRSRDVIMKRYGLGDGNEMTLEAIGSTYGITRERVRQIENQALKRLRESEVAESHNHVFSELNDVIASLGSIVPEQELLDHLTTKPAEQNHYYFLLMVGEPFTREKSNTKLRHRWHISEAISKAVHNAIDALKKELSPEELVPEDKLLEMFRDHLSDIIDERHRQDDEILKRWLKISKEIDANPLGEYGPADSPIVRLKGMRDYAYLVLRKQGNPMHFSEVTSRIEEMFGRKAHKATTHNELIRDPRFVLVGRGLYALSSWGYREGVVRDVIAEIIKENGPLHKDEVIEKVMKERYVKANTIMVNLQDQKNFKRMDDGRFDVIS